MFEPSSYFDQPRPGEWLLKFRDPTIPPIPIPSWIIEPHLPEAQEMELFRRELNKIFGQGRHYGREEGKMEIRQDLQELING